MKISGVPGHHIRLYDFASGKLVALLKGHADVVYSLAFSPDGQNLIGERRQNRYHLGCAGDEPGAGSKAMGTISTRLASARTVRAQ